MSILDGVAAQVASAITAANVFYDGTLQTGSKTPDGRGGFVVTETSTAIKYLIEDYKDFMRISGNVPPNERRIMILAHGLANPPKAEDTLIADGRKWTIIDTTTDPAKAVYICRAR